MRHRFESIEPCHQVLLTGQLSRDGVLPRAYGWIRKANGSKKRMRMQTAYIPKFHMNLISTILLREGHGILNICTMQLHASRSCQPELVPEAKIPLVVNVDHDIIITSTPHNQLPCVYRRTIIWIEHDCTYAPTQFICYSSINSAKGPYIIEVSI